MRFRLLRYSEQDGERHDLQCVVGPAELSSRVWRAEVKQAFDRWPGLHRMNFSTLWLLGRLIESIIVGVSCVESLVGCDELLLCCRLLLCRRLLP